MRIFKGYNFRKKEKMVRNMAELDALFNRKYDGIIR